LSSKSLIFQVLVATTSFSLPLITPSQSCVYARVFSFLICSSGVCALSAVLLSLTIFWWSDCVSFMLTRCLSNLYFQLPENTYFLFTSAIHSFSMGFHFSSALHECVFSPVVLFSLIMNWCLGSVLAYVVFIPQRTLSSFIKDRRNTFFHKNEDLLL
jgi:hypothetical protein